MKQGTGSALIELQRLDLELARTKQALANLPEVAELAKKRRALQKLQVEAKKLYAQRKDFDIELSDLADEEAACSAKVGEVQRLLARSTDYRIVQNYNQELSDLAKRLDKISFKRDELERSRAEHTAKEEQLAAYTERFEGAMVAETKQARAAAGRLQKGIEELEAERALVCASIDSDVLEEYAAASKRFNGLAVERLEGSVPSVCRTSLSPSAIADLRHVDEVGTCPYCHRMIVTAGEPA